MSGRIRVAIDGLVVDGGGIADAAAFRAEVERQIARTLASAGSQPAGRTIASVDGGRVKAAGDAGAVAAAIAAAIQGGGAK